MWTAVDPRMYAIHQRMQYSPHPPIHHPSLPLSTLGIIHYTEASLLTEGGGKQHNRFSVSTGDRHQPEVI